MLYVKKQYIKSILKEGLNENPNFLKENYKILYKCVEECGLTVSIPNEHKEEYVPINFLFQFRTIYNNTVIIPDGEHIYKTYSEIAMFQNKNLEEIILIATMSYLKSFFESDEQGLKDFLPNTEPLPLGVFYEHNKIYILTQIVLNDNTELEPLKYLDYHEVPFRELKTDKFDNVDELFYNKFIEIYKQE